MGSINRRGTAAFRGYGYRWRLARADHLRRNPFCAMHLERGERVEASVVDHKEPPRLGAAKASGDPERIAAAWQVFWDRDNWQSLCKHCHDSIKQRLEKSGRIAGCDASGVPLDPRHHWHRQG